MPLRVVEIGRDGDHRFGDRFSKMRLGVLFELAQNEGRDLRRREGLLAQLDADYRFAVRGDAERKQFQLVLNVGDAAPHQALHRVNGSIGLVDESHPGGVADHDFTGASQGNDARNQAVAIFTGDDFRRGEVHVGDQAVGCAKVDADDALSRLAEIDFHGCHINTVVGCRVLNH